MNILFLSHRIPFPPNKGDKIRSFQEIKYLGSQHNLYLAFLVDDERDLQYLAEVGQYCAAFDYDVINPRWQKLKSLPFLTTGKPLSIPYFYSDKLQRAIDKRIKESRIDAIVCFSSPMAEYVFINEEYRAGNWNGIRLIMDFVDVDSDKWRIYADFCGFPRSFIYRREGRRLQEYERRVGEAFDVSIFVSDKEVELFHTFCPTADAIAVSNGVDTDYFATVNDLRRKRSLEQSNRTILFMGAMDYFPNEDAVIYFADEIWPLVRHDLPDALFMIVGSKPSARLQALSSRKDGITVNGYVPDVRPFLADASVFVAPLRIARGVQNKVLEALAAGVPVVARPEAVQGITGHNGAIRVEDAPVSFARAVVECVNMQLLREQMIACGNAYIAEHHQWGRNLELLGQLL